MEMMIFLNIEEKAQIQKIYDIHMFIEAKDILFLYYHKYYFSYIQIAISDNVSINKSILINWHK